MSARPTRLTVRWFLVATLVLPVGLGCDAIGGLGDLHFRDMAGSGGRGTGSSGGGVTTGSGGSGTEGCADGALLVPAYCDTFTLTGPRTDGLLNDNSVGAYDVEHAPATATWKPSTFSFNTPQSSSDPALLGTAMGNPGAETGLAQLGGYQDFSFDYGDPSDNYVVQADAIIPNDRFDISSFPFAGSALGSDASLSVFFRRIDSPLPGIGIFNGGEAGTGCSTGITDKSWHTFAVHFDQSTSHVRMFVDGELTCVVNLATFKGGVYQKYSKAAVGMGGGESETWMDNFQAGPAAGGGNPAGDGSSASSAGASCNTIHQSFPMLPSGKYWVNPIGLGAFQVYCDMINDGGGWTRVVNVQPDSTLHADNPGTVGDVSIDSEAAKLSDALINELNTAGHWRFECGTTVNLFVTNTDNHWTSMRTNGLSWRTDRARDGTFECVGGVDSDFERVFSDFLTSCDKAHHTDYAGAYPKEGLGCFAADDGGWQHAGHLWAK